MKDLFISEEEYFEYYQNSCDPTFEYYPFPERDEEGVKDINGKMGGSIVSGDLEIFEFNDTDDDVFNSNKNIF